MLDGKTHGRGHTSSGGRLCGVCSCGELGRTGRGCGTLSGRDLRGDLGRRCLQKSQAAL